MRASKDKFKKTDYGVGGYLEWPRKESHRNVRQVHGIGQAGSERLVQGVVAAVRCTQHAVLQVKDVVVRLRQLLTPHEHKNHPRRALPPRNEALRRGASLEGLRIEKRERAFAARFSVSCSFSTPGLSRHSQRSRNKTSGRGARCRSRRRARPFMTRLWALSADVVANAHNWWEEPQSAG